MMLRFQLLFHIFGVKEFLPSNDFAKFIASKTCPLPLVKDVCGDVLFLIVGFDESHLNMVSQFIASCWCYVFGVC